MSCTINSGYSLGCRDNIGGIQKAYLGNFVSDITYTLDANNQITAFSGGTVSYYTFEQEQETGSFDQVGQYDTQAGTVFFEQNLSLTFHKNDATSRDRLLLLSQANISAIVLDQRGVYWLVGKQNGMRATEGSMNTGQSYGDMNGQSIVLQGKEPEPANVITGTAFSTFNIN